MITPVNHADSAGSDSDRVDDRWSLVLRITESPQFRKSPKLRELLLFVCERGLQNANEDLKEQSIGCQVFGRRTGYNPGEDNIVRVEIRQLRKRLDEYFMTSGKDEAMIVTVPKGSYVPCFEPRKADEAVQPEALPVPVPKAVEMMPKPGQNRMWRALAAVFAAIAIFSWLPKIESNSQNAASATKKRSPLWQEIFSRAQDTYVVCADSALVIIKEITRKPVTLNEYLTRTYPRVNSKSSDLDYVMSILPDRQYTSIADVHMVERLSLSNSEFWDRTSIRSARTLQMVDFKKNNFVLLGSSRANPWIELFEPQLNFVWTFDEQRRQGLLVNRSPKQGEMGVYRSEVPGQDSYSVIDFVPNLNRTGNVLIVAGATMEGTEGAAEYVTSSAFTGELLGRMHAVRDGKLLYFELVLKSGTLGGTSEGSQLVAYRVWNANNPS